MLHWNLTHDICRKSSFFFSLPILIIWSIFWLSNTHFHHRNWLETKGWKKTKKCRSHNNDKPIKLQIYCILADCHVQLDQTHAWKKSIIKWDFLDIPKNILLNPWSLNSSEKNTTNFWQMAKCSYNLCHGPQVILDAYATTRRGIKSIIRCRDSSKLDRRPKTTHV